MIVRNAGERVQLITQPDHARLSGRIMEHCERLMRHPRRKVILRAIAEHDNGWAEEDAAPTLDPATGEIADFVHASLAVRRQRVWPRGVRRLADDPWAAALVAQHGLTVYDRFRADAAWTGFFDELTASRDALVTTAGRPLSDLLEDYTFVRLGDLISLAFCTGWTDERRFEPWTVTLSGYRVIVTPDAFAGATVPIAITAREIRRQPFRSDADLHRAIAGAPTVTLRGTVAAAA